MLLKGDGMMSALARYLYSVAAAAIVCTIVKNILKNDSAQKTVLTTICGIFITFTIVSPLKEIRMIDMESFVISFADDGACAASLGNEMRTQKLRADIKARTEAYILDKANALQAHLQVEVILSDDHDMPVPVSVRLSGSISPYAKIQLQRALEDDLGIPKENQVWN